MQEDYYPSQQFPIGGDDDDDNDDDDGDEVKSPFACVWQAAAAKADECAGIMVPVPDPDRTKEWPEGPTSPVKKQRRKQLKPSQL